MIRVLLLLIFLCGCGGGSTDEPENNHGYGFEFDAAGQNGLKLKMTGATARDAELLEAQAALVADCAGIKAPPPPFVITVPRGSLGTRLGLYYSNPPLILIDEAWVSHAVVFGHETLHYLLDISSGDPDASHSNEAFSKCVVPLPH